MADDGLTHNTTAIAFQLKRVYGKLLTALAAKQKMTYNLFEESNRKAAIQPRGAGYYFGVRTKSNQAIGARGEDEYLPDALQPAGTQGVILPKYVYGTLRLSGPALYAAKGNEAAFVEQQGDAVMDTYESLVEDLNRQCHGDGHGKLAVMSTSATSSTSATWTVTCNNDLGVRYLKPGMVVDFYGSSGATPDSTCSSSRISSINPITRVVTMEKCVDTTYNQYHPNSTMRAYTPGTSTSTGQTIASADVIVRQGARDAAWTSADTPVEMVGLLGQYDDSTLLAAHEGITISSYPDFVANVLDNSGTNRALSLDLMLAAMDMTAARYGQQPNLIRMGLGQRRKYFALLAPDVRFAPGEFIGGYEKLAFSQNGAVSILVDPVTQPNKLFFEVDGLIKKYEMRPLGWLGEGEKMQLREHYDQWTMILAIYANLGVEARHGLTLLDDLTEPTGGTGGSMPF
ncbi:MAG: phage major capsid protein [Chloroflexi bacterium]|nr:MAG: phage major capsid protein [Chloroflexota bacterium]